MPAHSLSTIETHQAIATAHRVLANRELTPLILALVNQCLQSEVRPEHGMMLLLRDSQISGGQANRGSFHEKNNN